MNTRELLDYYGRRDVQEAMVSFGRNREVVGRRLRGDYNRRPDVLVYPDDVLRQAKDGTTSFHGSVELWRNPMRISTDQRPEEMAENRVGWDFLIDLDSSSLEHSKIAADLLVKALEAHGLSEIPVKFSGRSGFHIMVPFKLFPDEIDGKPAALQFPSAPRMTALYLQEFIREKFAESMLKREGTRHAFAESIGKKLEQVLTADRKEIDPFKSVKIDSILISPRHLVRMPYSLNEKSWLVSVPVDSHKILQFDSESARPEKIGKVSDFAGGKGSAKDLVEAAIIFQRKFESREEEKFRGEMDKFSGERNPGGKISEEAFPPCVRLILSQKTVDDGRKRRLFILQAFLQRAGWSVQEIAAKVSEWNSSLANPLQSVYVQGQMSYLAKQKKSLMAPNCAADGFYRELGVCKPDRFCENVKNPITAAVRHQRFIRISTAPPEKPKRKPRAPRKTAPPK
jgi:hypothetical protein